jgi:hypothetical protein
MFYCILSILHVQSFLLFLCLQKKSDYINCMSVSRLI